jgi:hypothetical protein
MCVIGVMGDCAASGRGGVLDWFLRAAWALVRLGVDVG